MINKQRGDVELKLGDERYAMRPTFQAMCEIENETGMGIVELAQRLWEGRFGGQHVTAVVSAGLRAACDDPPSHEEIGALVLKHGFQKLAGPVSAFLAVLLTGEVAPENGQKGADGERKKKQERRAARAMTA